MATGCSSAEHASKALSAGDYQDSLYWERMYAKQISTEEAFGTFDLYCSFSAVYPMLESLIDHSKSHNVLVVGVGRSNVIDELLKRGFTSITAIDVSPSLVSKLRSKYETNSNVDISIMDVCMMSSLRDDLFTIVIDKACLDALFCTVDYVWSVRAALTEIQRVLQPRGDSTM
jgi:ubiquinone/menaquinone biosynthesis C-methylase UbiE